MESRKCTDLGEVGQARLAIVRECELSSKWHQLSTLSTSGGVRSGRSAVKDFCLGGSHGKLGGARLQGGYNCMKRDFVGLYKIGEQCVAEDWLPCGLWCGGLDR